MISLPLCLALALPQDPVSKEDLARFRALAPALQAQVVAAIESRLQQEPDPVLRRIAGLAGTVRNPPALAPRTWHDPAEFAPVAAARTLWAEGSDEQRTARRQFPAVRFFRELHAAVVYDWRTGKAALAAAAGPAERFEALLRGLPPGSDAAIAAILARIDTNGDQRRVAGFFEQLYADRNGNVFAGISLYEAWYAGRTIEVPDVDAIAFARNVLHTWSFVAPIPDGRRRDRLYRQVQTAFARHREYRTLRQAAAATFVAADPPLEAIYQPLVGRLHYLWSAYGYDADRMAQRLDAGDRTELLADVDREFAAGEAQQLRDQARQQLIAAASTVHAAAIDELRKAAGK